MNKQEQEKLACELLALSVFRNILNTKTVQSLVSFLTETGKLQKINFFGEFVYSLAEFDYSFSKFLCNSVLTDENEYILSVAQKKKVSEIVLENATKELELFSNLSTVTSDELFSDIDFKGYVPKFENSKTDFKKLYEEQIKNISKVGYGIFAAAKMFKVSGEQVIPIKSADEISVDSFVGYKEQRKQIFDNTKALCEGKPAANILLYGDAGTGKSSTVKACANYFYNEGVRLIEIRKDQLLSLSFVMGKIANNPLKFIIFIDDLSFNKNDDNFSMLKAALEGSASAKANNAVIYATSNRRHIIKESFADRHNNDDIHINDTIQELTSLSDRFGLTVYFEKPNKNLYLEIVFALAKRNNIKTDKEELSLKAETFALNRGNRSPRVAEQFINSLIL
ncbi:MAG: ATP-binding protein [Elusimicrobia bacterium]|nr:ATP-binding protein [Elusimicrobiota bacterium]